MFNAAITMLIVGSILGAMLGVASLFFEVEIDEREEKVTSMLPGYNCGGCGHAGCSALAKALVSKTTDTINCKPCKPEKRQEIADYLNNTPGPNGETLNVKVIN